MKSTIQTLTILAAMLTAACNQSLTSPTTSTSTTGTAVATAPEPTPAPTPAPAPTWSCAQRNAEIQTYIASRNNDFDTAMVMLSVGELVYIEWQYDPKIPRNVYHVSGPVCVD